MRVSETDDQQAAPPVGSQRLFFHVGLPKSGSTYLQGILGTHRNELREAGHVYPFVGREAMFHAAVEMAGEPDRWGLDPAQIDGTFAHLLRRGRRLGGTVLLSHEIFGAASPEQVDTMGEQLADFDLHVVVTARDLGRSVTAAWQEEVKNGRLRSFAEFSDGLLDEQAMAVGGRTFWRSQHLPRVLGTWGRLVAPDHVHVVPCPPAGTAPHLLWDRFAEAVDLDPAVADLSTVPVRNESLSAAKVAFLIDVLTAVDGRLEQPWHSRVAKRWFAQSLLAGVPGDKPVAPPDLREQLASLSTQWVEQVRAAGYRVHGDLDDLLPRPDDGRSPHPDEVGAEDRLAGLPEVVAEMLVRTRALHEEIATGHDERRELSAERDQLREQVAGLTAELAKPPPPPPPTATQRVARRVRRVLSRS